MSTTLADLSVSARYKSGRNSLNALRLLLATLVIVAHAWPIGGHGEMPDLLGVPLGTWAVAGFFGISGYLITVSRESHRILPYLTRRALRIYPGFWAVLVVTGFVFAPIAAHSGSGTWHVADAVHYLRYTFTLHMHAYNVGSTLHDAPYPSAWDGSLWTLRWEFICYLIVGVLFVIPRFRQPMLWVVFAAAAVHSWARGDDFSNFVAYFFAGALIAANRRRLPLAWWLAIPAAGLAVLGGEVGHLPALGSLGLAYVLLYLGVALPLRGFGQRHDLSYGMYIYGFPIAQLLVLAGIDKLPLGVAALVEVVATVPLAAASWFLVERPAQGLGPRLDPVWRRVTAAVLPSRGNAGSRDAVSHDGGPGAPVDVATRPVESAGTNLAG